MLVFVVFVVCIYCVCCLCVYCVYVVCVYCVYVVCVCCVYVVCVYCVDIVCRFVCIFVYVFVCNNVPLLHINNNTHVNPHHNTLSPPKNKQQHRFLNDNVDKLGSLSQLTAQDLGWANKPLIGVTPEKPAIEAMQLMVEKGISAVAVLGRNDKLIGNFSVSELRWVA